MGLGPVPYVDKNNQPYQPCQLVSVPFFHVSGTHGGLLLALWSGTKLVIMKKWDPPEASGGSHFFIITNFVPLQRASKSPP